jgi:hypothetical protein
MKTYRNTQVLILLAFVAALLGACSKKDDGGPGPGPGPGPESNGGPRRASVKLLLEIEQMVNTKPVQLTQKIGDQEVSLVEIYRQAGVELRIVEGRKDIPWQDTVRRADLHAMMLANNGATPAADEIKVKLLVLSRDASERPGENLFGVMFDYGDGDTDHIPRQGFAVYEKAHESLAGGLSQEVLLTIAHELTHVFNLHHSDWDGQNFGSHSTIEGYSFTDTVQWKLSAASLDHLTGHSCPQTLVVPGKGGQPFGFITQTHSTRHKSMPAEPFDIVSDDNVGARSRIAPAAHMAARSAASGTSGLQLVLAAPKSDYVVGEAITLTAALKNVSNASREVFSQFDPEYRLLVLAIKGPGESQARAYLPPFIRDSRGNPTVAIAPQESLATEAKVFFGSTGWNFKTPGRYEITAAYPPGGPSSNEYVWSEPITLNVNAPATDPTRRAFSELQSNESQVINKGLYLYMGGGNEILREAEASMNRILKEASGSPHANDARVALASDVISTFDAGKASVETLIGARDLLRAARQAPGMSSTSLLRTQQELIDALRQAGRNADANAEQANLQHELGETNKLRALDRRALERRL